MFTLDNVEYDENKLNDNGKLAFVQLQNIRNRNNQLAIEQEQLNVLAEHYTNILKNNLPEEKKEETKAKKK